MTKTHVFLICKNWDAFVKKITKFFKETISWTILIPAKLYQANLQEKINFYKHASGKHLEIEK